MTEPEDRGHLLPDDAWAHVVADAEQERQRIAAGQPPAEAPAEDDAEAEWLASFRPTLSPDESRRFGTGVNLGLSGVVHADSHGGARGRNPTFAVLHSAETPLRAGYASSLSRNWFGPGGGAPTSCHYFTDPAETWGVLPDGLIAYHVGGANRNSLGLEQAGYARFTRAEWLTPEGRAQMARNAVLMRAVKARYGIGLYWMTDQQLRDAHAGRIVGGWTTHDQCRRVIGSTTHTDPGKGFPYDLQMQLATGAGEEDDDVDVRNMLKTAVVANPHAPGKEEPAYFGIGLMETRLAGAVLASEKRMETRLAGLSAAVDKLAQLVATGTADLTTEQITAAVRSAVEDAVVQVDVNVRGQLEAETRRMAAQLDEQQP